MQVYKRCRCSQAATSVTSAFQPSHSFLIHLVNRTDHAMDFEGQHPINIMLNKTSFHAEKKSTSANLTDLAPILPGSRSSQKNPNSNEGRGRGGIRTAALCWAHPPVPCEGEEPGWDSGKGSGPVTATGIAQEAALSSTPRPFGSWASVLLLPSASVGQQTGSPLCGTRA